MVSNLNDAGPGSLRAAILGANRNGGTDQICFANDLHGTIKLTSGGLSHFRREPDDRRPRGKPAYRERE